MMYDYFNLKQLKLNFSPASPCLIWLYSYKWIMKKLDTEPAKSELD
jgi:hypothetical protein